MWNKYKKVVKGEELISEESFEQFFNDMGLNTEKDMVCLYISALMETQTMGEIRK